MRLLVVKGNRSIGIKKNDILDITRIVKEPDYPILIQFTYNNKSRALNVRYEKWVRESSQFNCGNGTGVDSIRVQVLDRHNIDNILVTRQTRLDG
jgi:hypothetical protein